MNESEVVILELLYTSRLLGAQRVIATHWWFVSYVRPWHDMCASAIRSNGSQTTRRSTYHGGCRVS